MPENNDLKQLCIKYKEAIGKMVTHLQEMNVGRGTDPIGTCCPLSGEPCFSATQSQCASVPGDWHIRDTVIPRERYERVRDKFLKDLPVAAKALNDVLSEKANKDVAHELVKLLRSGPVGVGICLLPNGDCSSLTKKECDEAGGVWSHIRHARETDKRKRPQGRGAVAKGKKPTKAKMLGKKPTKGRTKGKRPTKAKKRSRR